jgi:hypothetical protein
VPASRPGGGGLRVQSRVGRQQSLFPAALPRARTDTITNLLSFGLPSRAYEDLCESDPVIVWNTQNRRTVATANELQIAAWAGAVAISLPVIRVSVNCGSQRASNLDHDRRNVVTLDVLLFTPMKS